MQGVISLETTNCESFAVFLTVHHSIDFFQVTIFNAHFLYSITACRRTVRPFTERDDTRGCNNTICPPEDEQGTARNILRIIIYMKEVCIKLVT